MAQSPSSPATEDAQAAAALAAGKFREAVELFKTLRKREARPEWLQGLAQAYAGRAQQLADKGMVQEALALWRTRAQACNLPLLEGPYLGWLARTGQLQSALPELLAGAHEGPPEQQTARQAGLAARVLAAPESALASLPPTSPLKLHWATARAALAAAAAGDAAALEAALQPIPFRSPYRDLRPVLKAMALLRSDSGAAEALLARVAPGGPFELLAAPLRVAVLPAPQWLAAWRNLPAAGRTLVLDLKGCPPEQHPLIDVLATPPAEPKQAPEVLFKALVRCQKLLPRGLPRRWALRLWPHLGKRPSSEFSAPFGPMADHELMHTSALAAEIEQDVLKAEPYWERTAQLLAQQPGQASRAAHIWRRLACRPLAAGVVRPEMAGWLEKSLAADPDHPGAHLDLVRIWRQLGDAKSARARLDTALTRWPNDTALLQQAVELALESNAFKKAATLAKQVLRLDPLNPRVPQLIGQAHMSHARKLIKTHKQEAALRELDQAAGWALRDPAALGRLQVLRALAGPVGEAKELLPTAMARLGGPLVGRLQLALECLRVGVEPRPWLASVATSTAATAAELLALAHMLNAEPARDRWVAQAMDMVVPQLKKALPTTRLPADDWIVLAEALYRHRLTLAATLVTAVARRQWPEDQALLYLDLLVRYHGQPWLMQSKERQTVLRGIDTAKSQGDLRTAKRLIEFVRGAPDEPPRGRGSRRRPRISFMNSMLDDDDGFDDFSEATEELDGLPAEQLIKMVSDAVDPSLRPIFEERTRGLTPEQIKQQMLDMLAALQNGTFPGSPPPRKTRK